MEFFSFSDAANYILSLKDEVAGTYEVKVNADETSGSVKACSLFKDVLRSLALTEGIYVSLDLSESSIEIGDHAFSDCNRLLTIILPEGIKKIGKSAFRHCTSLESVENLQDVNIGEDAFFGCYSLKNQNTDFSSFSEAAKYIASLNLAKPNTYHIKIRDNEYGSGMNACDILKDALSYVNSPDVFISLDLSECIIKIGEKAFSSCSALKEITLPSIAIIGKQAFSECENLEEVVLQRGLREIGEEAFLNCTSLKPIENLDNIKIGKDAFKGCPQIDDDSKKNCTNSFAGEIFYSFSDAAKYIDSLNKTGTYEVKIKADENAERVNACEVLRNALYHISSPYIFVALDLSECIMKIGDNAFAGCELLESINIPASVEVIGNWAFGNSENGKSCSSLKTVILHEGLKEICEFAFYGCESLKSIEIPASVEVIGNWAFGGGPYIYNECSSLKTVILHEGLKEIKSCAFKQCRALKSIEIPASVQSIEEAAFEGCSIDITFNEPHK